MAPVTEAVSAAAGFVAGTASDSSEVRCTMPSRNAYNESKNAFVIFEMKICGTLLLTNLDEPDAIDGSSVPPTSLNAPVVRWRWNSRIWARYNVVEGSVGDPRHVSR